MLKREKVKIKKRKRIGKINDNGGEREDKRKNKTLKETEINQ